ncbi:MAG: regulatory protein RecX [Bacteroidales bacterium]
MKIYSPAEALHKAAAYCSKSEHCISEINEKLRQWGIGTDDADVIIARLQKEKFIDEARYCRSFINDKYKYNRWGRIKIAYALRMKRIPDAIVYEMMDEVINEETYLENLQALIKEKRKTTKGNNPMDIHAKLYRFAAGRGFESSEISRILKSE